MSYFSADRLTKEVMNALPQSAAGAGPPAVLGVPDISKDELIFAVGCRVVGVLARGAVSVERLAQAVLTAARYARPSHRARDRHPAAYGRRT